MRIQSVFPPRQRLARHLAGTVLGPKLTCHQRYQHQLLKGCRNSRCKTTTCYTFCKSKNDKPPRKLSLATARAAAFYLADSNNPESQLCPYILPDVLKGPDSTKENALAVGSKHVVEGAVWLESWKIHREEDAEWAEDTTRQDPSSFSQRLFNTRGVKAFMSSTTASAPGENANVETMYHELLETEKHFLIGVANFRGNTDTVAAVEAVMKAVSTLRKVHLAAAESFLDDTPWDAKFPWEIRGPLAHTRRQMEDLMQNPDALSLRLACTLNEFVAFLRRSSSHGLLARFELGDFLQSDMPISTEEHLYSQILLRLTQDKESVKEFSSLGVWMELVFRKYWDNSMTICENSFIGNALTVWDMLKKHDSISNLTSLDLHIRDPMNAAYQWRRSCKTKRKGFLNLIDYPWIISRQSQVQYFRALCFYRMSDAIDQARLNVRLLYNSFSSLIHDGRPPPQGPSLQSGQLQMAMSRYLTLQVYRGSILPDAIDELWRRQRRELFRPLRIKMLDAGEVGVDQGGLAQEFIRLVWIEAFNPAYGLFLVEAKTRMAWFDPKSLEPLYKYQMLGLLMALAIFNGLTLPVTFPLALYSKLCGEAVEYRHIKNGWPDLESGLKQLQTWSDGDVGDVFLRSYTFTFEAFGAMVHTDMTKSNADEDWSPIVAMTRSDSSEDHAPLVTNSNREQYVVDYISWLTDKSIHQQYQAFAEGFHTVLEPRLLQTIMPEVLQDITEGQQFIDTRLLEKAAKYDAGYGWHKPYVRDFWAIVHSYDYDQKKALLEFVTASDRVPVTGIETVDFIVQRHGGDTESLPTSVTCFGRLLLPEYRNKEKLRQKLAVALENSKGFGLS